MIEFWAAYKARKEAENPTPPLDMNEVSMMCSDGDEHRTFGDFEEEGHCQWEEEQCLPGDSRLKCVGWRYEVVTPEPRPVLEPRENLVQLVGHHLLNQLQSVYNMYGPPVPREQVPPPSPPKPVTIPVVAPEPRVASVTAPAKAPRKSLAPAPRPSTSTAAPGVRALRPRSSAAAAPAPRKPAARQSLPASHAPVVKPAPRQSLAPVKVAPR
ncbi:hypothetical protein H0H87_001050, partial [Tephrocybe sp. NHM501043]